MRNPARIKKILKHIEKIWIKYPDLRLFQLLINFAKPAGVFEDDLYNVEDDIVESNLACLERVLNDNFGKKVPRKCIRKKDEARGKRSGVRHSK